MSQFDGIEGHRLIADSIRYFADTISRGINVNVNITYTPNIFTGTYGTRDYPSTCGGNAGVAPKGGG